MSHPLVVDLDGTLLRTDTLFEFFVAALTSRPIEAFRSLSKLFDGRAQFKEALARIDANSTVIADLPFRADFVNYLRSEHANGRELHLASAAHQTIVDKVASHFGWFKSARGSSGDLNLKSTQKAKYLSEAFPDGFAYAGDDVADLDVWKKAKSIVLVGASKTTAKAARDLGIPVEAEFDTGRPGLKTWMKSLRIHQWAKNLLLFIPFLLGASEQPFAAILNCVLGFLLLGISASATYLINDLTDLKADRRHKTKSRRPLASGELPLTYALLAIPFMLAFSLISAFFLSSSFFILICLYLVVTLSYSIKLKRVALLDVIVLGFLYTLRLFMGMVLVGLGSSVWLLAFSAFFFFSMSLAKRHVEVVTYSGASNVDIPGRGYRASDWPLTLSFGVASTVASILIMIQYLMAEAFPSNTYSLPGALWMAPFIIGLWTCRIWLLAQRGELDDDPVAFATKDKLSLLLGGVLGASFVLARFG
jgi:4-hydroxybenzoate polyprenyltransferase